MAKTCFSLVFAVLFALHKGSNPVVASTEVEMPESCAGQSYCFEKGANYPEEKIETLLGDMSELKVDNPEPRPSIDSRNGDTYDEPECLSNSTEEPIFYIIDKKTDRVRVVVQSPKKFQQIYSVKWCQQEGPITRDTRHFMKNSPILNNFKLECVSTKMDFEFIVLSDEVDPVSNKTIMEIAKAKEGIPVCCKCRYTLDD